MEEVSGSGTGICCVPIDVLEAHILTRLDGPSLASLSCTSATLHSLCSQTHLWFNLFHATWPSTATSPHLRHLISAAGDPCSLFSYAFSLPPTTTTASHLNCPPQTQQLISAVDIHFGDNLIFNKVQETETVSGWFNCSPFRVDLLDPKETVPTRIPYPGDDDSSTCCCRSFLENMKLSWILIDPTRPGLMNLSSFSPVSATRHWLSKEVAVKFATVLGRGNALVECVIVVGCGETDDDDDDDDDDDGEVMLQVREVSLEMEDMEGKHLNGRDSIVILQNTMSSSNSSSSSTKRKGRKGREEEGKRRYREYVEKKEERKEQKLRVEWVLDTLSVLFVVASLAFAATWLIGIAICSV